MSEQKHTTERPTILSALSQPKPPSDPRQIRQRVELLERMLCRPLPEGERPALRAEYIMLRDLEDACV